jgi:hypothetical protein
MTAHRLAAVLAAYTLAPDEPPPVLGRAPCDCCPHARSCGGRLRACDAFALYIDGASEREWRAAQRTPGRDSWVRSCMADEDEADGVHASVVLR